MPPSCATVMARLLPATVTNEFPGHMAALIFYGALTVVMTIRSCIHMLAPDGGAEIIATIPLSDMDDTAEMAVIGAFGQWGWSQLLMSVVYIIVLVRYRGLIPLCLLLSVVEWVGRIFVGILKPVPTRGVAPGKTSNYVIPPIAFIFLILSVWPCRKVDSAAESAEAKDGQ
eukprot:TRINITY_DN24487_c0_g1_i1.p1 TRINITY_DN24487_c0_g1~~TRINITY_DN24487_c0_g1_i1.p1  ORF type:complete len:171 (+),score=19.95 TRINITY_DN24487_c0_g1_i1:72-584(+)